jgi:hypothetical protein
VLQPASTMADRPITPTRIRNSRSDAFMKCSPSKFYREFGPA